ncbi:MOB kinase activator 3C isoform X1 [Lepisosteus oculatus]
MSLFFFSCTDTLLRTTGPLPPSTRCFRGQRALLLEEELDRSVGTSRPESRTPRGFPDKYPGIFPLPLPLALNRMALCLGQVFSKDKTFRPRKRFEPGTQRFELYKKAQASLKSGLDLRKVVQLPEGESINDWIAVHVVDFFNRINLIYGTVSEFCTERSCPVMSGGQRYEYRWQDGHLYKKPTKLPALQYMNLLMDWIETLINNENIFPTRIGVPFPKNFQQVCKKILSRLFRVFVHVYIHHFDRICSMGAEAHINTCYKHYYYFITEFSLIEHSELEPLKEMTEKICT